MFPTIYFTHTSNFGPNATTFVIPGEIYPPEVKATCHGLSAASGKLGEWLNVFMSESMAGSMNRRVGPTLTYTVVHYAGAAAGAYMFPLLLNMFPHSTLGLRLCFFTCALVALVGQWKPTYECICFWECITVDFKNISLYMISPSCMLSIIIALFYLAICTTKFLFRCLISFTWTQQLQLLLSIPGAVSTYYFIPTYSARDLEDPDAYLALDHDCMRPSAELVMYMEQVNMLCAILSYNFMSLLLGNCNFYRVVSMS